MLFNSSQLSLNIILLVLGIYNQVDITMAARKCYVCGYEGVSACDNLNPENEAVIKECPSSCETAYNAGRQIRDCAMGFNGQDCKVANEIRYCFCNQDLCNGNSKIPSDDEDIEEGSGTTTIKIKNTNQNEQKPSSNITNQSSHIQLYLYSTYISVFAILCN